MADRTTTVSKKPIKQPLCCTHPEQRIDTPEPPSRPLASIDGIFAAAALPEDHPHALSFSHKKPQLDDSIVRSPGWGDKLRMQGLWGRKKSVKRLRKEGEYDGDARVITSRDVSGEVRDYLGEVVGSEGTERSCSQDNEYKGDRAEPTDLERLGSSSQNESRADVRTSVLGSAEYLRAVIEQ